ncbi:MAG: hypothetical protein JSS17_08000 [Proteobacteria bacterium]|nr:hypothetical protein [Pseudomonadota bacterium]
MMTNFCVSTRRSFSVKADLPNGKSSEAAETKKERPAKAEQAQGAAK